MGKESGKVRSEFDREVLDHFSGSVLRHFARLLNEFGFAVYESRIHRPDVWVKLRNTTTQVMIDYEWGVGCWVTVGRLTRWLKRVPEEYSLEDIAQTIQPTMAFPDVSCLEYDAECIDTALRGLAEVAFTTGTDLLQGNFSVGAQITARRVTALASRAER